MYYFAYCATGAREQDCVRFLLDAGLSGSGMMSRRSSCLWFEGIEMTTCIWGKAWEGNLGWLSARSRASTLQSHHYHHFARAPWARRLFTFSWDKHIQAEPWFYIKTTSIIIMTMTMIIIIMINLEYGRRGSGGGVSENARNLGFLRIA